MRVNWYRIPSFQEKILKIKNHERIPSFPIMKIFLKILFAIVVFLFTTANAFAQDNLPFTDIKADSPYYNAVKNLYDARVISDDGSHLFRADAPMNRDFFVSLAVQIGCKQCLTPTVDDLIQYQQSPFVDFPKTNQFYYCVAYAANEGITQGYITDNSGKTSCENGETFSSNPFCAENSISRIEAAAMLLRRANLWNESLNSSNFDRSENISDVSYYWYGYAKKALEVGILTKKSDNSIWQDEKITRGEFALMSSVILGYTQCNIATNNNSHASYIEIQDKTWKTTDKTVFGEWEIFTLIPRTEPGRYTYNWTAKNEDWQTITGNGDTFDGSQLPPWTWFIDTKISDPSTGTTISNPSVTITIVPKQSSENPDGDDDNDGVKNRDDMCPTVAWPKENNGCPNSTEKIGVAITGNPLVTHIGDPITFTPQITGTTEPNLVYNWDFGDGSHDSTGGTKDHTYDSPWTKTVTLTVTNPNTGNTAQTTMIVRITDDRDSDGDGVLDSADKCPMVKWPASNNGCPEIKTPDYGCSIREIYSGNPNCNHTSLIDPNTDTDGDGLRDPKDPNNPQNTTDNNTNNSGTGNNSGNNSWTSTGNNSNTWNTSGGGNNNSNAPEDHCMYVPGPISNLGCPLNGDWDDDNDGVKNRDDRCPTVAGTIKNHGCPNNTGNGDSDGDGILDNNDLCPQVRGLPEWGGCPYPELYGDITKNVCLLNKLNTTGLITGVPTCNACPCVNQVNITSQLRECDIVFPSILSPDKKTIYSRGNFYLIQ